MNFSFLSNYLTLGVLTYLGKGFFTTRNNDKYHNIIIYQVTCLFLCFINLCFKKSNIFVTLFIYISYLMFVFTTDIMNYIFVSLLYLLISFTSSLVVKKFIDFLSLNFSMTNMSLFSSIFLIVLSTLISFIVCRLYIKVKKITHFFNVSNILIFVYPLIIIIFIVFVNNGYIHATNEILIYLLSSVLLFSNIIVFIGFYNSMKKIDLTYKLNISLEKEHFLKEKYELLDQVYNNNFNMLHNILHYCKILTNQVEKSEYDDLSFTIKELTDTTYKEFELIHTNSIVLNTLLSNRYQEIIDNNIYINTVIQHNDFSFMKITDSMELFSILLNSAIESCKATLNKRNITIKTLKRNENVIIQYKFPNANYVVIENERINKVIENYDGLISDSYNEELGYKSIIIYLKQKNNSIK